MKFEEPSPLNSVAKFHKTFGLPVLDEPQLISKERSTLRVNLLREELKELEVVELNHLQACNPNSFSSINFNELLSF